MRRNSLILMVVGLVMVVFAAMPVAAANPNAKWFVCKYVGTPGVDEVLQTGQNPISVSENAIPVSPVTPGLTFADSQGRSLVLEEDIGQEEPFAECPEVLPSPTPTPSPSPSIVTPPPTPEPTPPPTPEPTPPPSIQFSVTVCPTDATASLDFLTGLTALDVPEGQSAIRFRVVQAAFLITNFTVRIDGVVLTLENTLGDGTVGDRIVSPGLHSWSISNAEDTEVLASGEIECPVCTPVVIPPPPAPVPDTAMPISSIVGVVGVAVLMLGGLLLFNSYSVSRRT